METEAIYILLFVVATAVAIAVQRLAVPFTVALVFTGLALGLLDAFEAPQLTKALLFSVFLPGLLFEAAFHIEFRPLAKPPRHCFAGPARRGGGDRADGNDFATCRQRAASLSRFFLGIRASVWRTHLRHRSNSRRRDIQESGRPEASGRVA